MISCHIYVDILGESISGGFIKKYNLPLIKLYSDKFLRLVSTRASKKRIKSFTVVANNDLLYPLEEH